MAKTEFLKVQFDERFALLLTEFLETQTLYAPEQLPFDLVKELFFCHYAFMEDRGRSVFEDRFTKLFFLLYHNVRIEHVVDWYTNPKMTGERVKYIIYYNLYKNVMMENGTREIGVWSMFLPDVNREFFVTQGVKSNRDDLIFEYDINGILDVTAREISTGKEKNIVIVSEHNPLTKEKIEEKRRRMNVHSA